MLQTNDYVNIFSAVALPHPLEHSLPKGEMGSQSFGLLKVFKDLVLPSHLGLTEEHAEWG